MEDPVEPDQSNTKEDSGIVKQKIGTSVIQIFNRIVSQFT